MGSEQDGTGNSFDRPILILKGFSKHTCLIAPLTSSPEKHKMRIPIGKVQEKDSSVILSQMRVIDTKRLIYKVSFLDKSIFDKITKTVKGML